MEKRMIKAVILDMDGTMIDTERQAALDWPAVGEHYGFTVDEAFIHTFLGLTGAVKIQKLKELLPHLDPHEVMLYYRTLTKARFDRDGIMMKPGLVELLSHCQTLGLKLAVASAAPLNRIQTIVADLKIDDYFDLLIGGDLITHQKPHPEIYLLTSSRLGFDPSECLVIEDSRVGIEAAYRAKTHPILVPDVELPDHKMLSHSLSCVSSLFEVIPVIDGLLNSATE